MYQPNTSGSAASNMILSNPRALTKRLAAPVRQVVTFSVMPSDSIIIMETPGLRDGPFRVTRSLRLQFGARASAAGAELNANFRLGLHPVALHFLDQAQQIIGRHRDEAAGYLHDVEAQLFALAEIAANRLRTLRQHMLDETAGRDKNIVSVAEIDQFLDNGTRHQRKRADRKFERVDINAHRFQDVLEIALAHR